MIHSYEASSRSSGLYLPQHWAAGHHSEDCTEEELDGRPSPRLLVRCIKCPAVLTRKSGDVGTLCHMLIVVCFLLRAPGLQSEEG